MLWQRGKAYSQDLRERVLAAADDGARVGRIAQSFRVSVSYVSKVLSRRRRTGQTTALPQRCHVTPKLTTLHEAIRAQVAAQPDATIEELRNWLSATHQVSASNGLMWKTLGELKLTLKKSHSRPPNRAARMSPSREQTGATNSPRWIPSTSSSSMKPGPRRI